MPEPTWKRELRRPPLAALLAWVLLLGLPAGCDRKTEKTPTVPPEAVEQDVAAPKEPAEPWTRRVIDAHTHLSPLSYPLIRRQMDAVGIERAINMSGGSDQNFRRQSLALADEYYGRFAIFHNVAWKYVDDDNFGQQQADALRAAVADGYAGLKISKALGLGVKTKDGEYLKVDDPRLDPIWKAAGELGVVVAIHTGDPKAFFEKPGPENERHAELSMAPNWSFYGDEYPSREELLAARDRMLERHPDTTFMLLHFANNPEDVDYVDRLLDEHPNVVVDVAARLGEIGRHDAEKVRRIFVEHQDRILFATDLMLRVQPQGDRYGYSLTLGSISEQPPELDDVAPFYQQHFAYFEKTGEAIEHPVPIQGDWKVHPIGLPPEVLDKLYFQNAERLVFAPWLARRAALRVVEGAQDAE